MKRLPLTVLVLGLVLVAPASGDDLHGQKAAIDAKIQRLHSHTQQLQQREDAIRGEIASVTSQIRTLEAQVGDVASQLETLQADLGLHQKRLAKLNQLYALRTRQLNFMRKQYEASIDKLNQRLVDIYESEQTDLVGVILSGDDFDSLIDQVDFIKQIGEQDRQIATQVRVARNQVQIERFRTKKARSSMAAETQAIAVRTEQKRLVKEQLIANQSSLSAARDDKKVSLDKLSEQEQAEAGEIDALQVQSASVAAKIQAAQAAAQAALGSSAPSAPSSAPGGYQWPVSGPVTSPFGWRWGRLHEGIDIAVPSGTPVHASAAGTVIYASWMDGYGNFVIVDHGGGIATAYGHNTSLAVTVGQSVSQGEVLAYSGSTGHSTGPHVHFEVRVNGSAVDPLGYL
jgi:murein DD-endopeptidase MepM/ murein hydrolase activator NlpD